MLKKLQFFKTQVCTMYITELGRETTFSAVIFRNFSEFLMLKNGRDYSVSLEIFINFFINSDPS